jgi:very-short-patch-repair endonuclease
METRLRLLLMRAGLPEPELNPAVPVDGRVLHPDLLYRPWALVLEYEGDGHRTDPTAWRRDISRREALQSAGYRVLQVHSDDLRVDPQCLVARVSRAISEHAHTIR